MAWLTACAGLVLLLVGGELLVRGATRVALAAGVSTTVVGLTVVAAGTSMPELVVSVGAAWRGAPDVAVGNVVGSNIYNVLLILGVAAMVRPLAVEASLVRREWPVLVVASGALLVLARGGLLARGEGAILFAAALGFTALTVWLARTAATPDDREGLAAVVEDHPAPGTRRAWLMVAAGVALLGLGADRLVSGATEVATALGVSQRVIGLTLVALGTSLPELVTSVVASYRGDGGIAVGNVIGSNIFNLFAILGLTALVHPVPVHPQTLAWDAWVMLGVAVLLLPVMWPGHRITRVEGAGLFALAVGWTASLV